MNKSALVVDNSPSVLRLMKSILEKKNYQVKTATDGLQALQQLDTFKPDIIFIDLIMPNISGDRLCRIVRRKPGFDSVFITIISAIAAEQQIDYLSIGADACVAKGSMKEFEKNISTVIAHSEQNGLQPFSEKVLGIRDIYERDITKELLGTKKHYEVTLENMQDSFIEVNRDGTIVFANKAASKLFGTRNEDIVSSSFFEYFTDDEAKEYIKTTFDKLSGNPVEIGEKTIIPINKKYILIKFIPISDGINKNVIIIINDITRRKNAEDKLYQQMMHLEDIVKQKTAEYEEANECLQEEVSARKNIQQELERSILQWKNTFDTINDFISIHDTDFRLIMANSSLIKFIGKDAAEILGKYCYEVIHDSGKPWPNCPHLLAIKNNKTVTSEIYDKKNGRTFLVTCSPYMDDHGELIGTVHIARDITERKKIEQEREELIAKLKSALDEIKTLKGILPLCSFCKKIRNDAGVWVEVDTYIHQHSEADISHSICPECVEKHYPAHYKSIFPKKE